MAGNARFHDKLHRKNHHTNPTVGYADSASDPIASPSEPFQGDFVVNGKLSASSGIQVLSAKMTGDIYCNTIHVSSVTYTNWISGNSTETIISDGSLTGNGNNTLTLDYQKGIYGKSAFFSISNTLCSLGTITSPIATFDTLTVKTSTNLNGPLSVFGNTNLNGNLFVSGNLSAMGDTLQINTNIVSTSAMIIDTLGTTDALRVTQRGTGNAILVEDDTNPDSSSFVINNAGNVGIGTTNPTAKLHVSAGNAGALMMLETDNTSSQTSLDFICNSTGGRRYRVGTGGSAGVFQNGTFGFYDVTSSATRMAVTSGGDVYIVNLAGVGNRAVYSGADGTLTNTSSDGTLKQNVSSITQGLNEVLQLNSVSFNWKDTEKYGPQREIGFIAQEVQPIIPEVIGENHNGTLSLDYPKMIAVLTKAIQELNDKVEAQAAEITSLKAKIK